MKQDDRSAGAMIIDCRDRGYLAQRLYIVETEPRDGLDDIFLVLEPRLGYRVDLENKGVLFAAGLRLPVDESAECSGVGMVIFRANSFQEAEKIALADPMHSSGARRYALTPWLLNHLHARS
jgi:hypothetical protein